MNPLGEAFKTLATHMAAVRAERRQEAAAHAEALDALVGRGESSTEKPKPEVKPDSPEELKKKADLANIKALLIAKAMNDKEQEDAAMLATPKRTDRPGDAGKS